MIKSLASTTAEGTTAAQGVATAFEDNSNKNLNANQKLFSDGTELGLNPGQLRAEIINMKVFSFLKFNFMSY